MKNNGDEYRPRTRVISVTGNTAVLSLILAVFALWHNNQMDVLKLSYENLILSLQSEIKGLEQSGKINEAGSNRIVNILQELVDSRTNMRRIEPVIVVIIGILVFLLFTTLIASLVVIRNRAVLTAVYKAGFHEGAEKGNENLALPEAEEFIRNYVQKGGE